MNSTPSNNQLSLNLLSHWQTNSTDSDSLTGPTGMASTTSNAKKSITKLHSEKKPNTTISINTTSDLFEKIRSDNYELEIQKFSSPTLPPSELTLRQRSSIASLLQASILNRERYLYAKRNNHDNLPDFSDHCTPSYLDTIENLSKKA